MIGIEIKGGIDGRTLAFSSDGFVSVSIEVIDDTDPLLAGLWFTSAARSDP